MQLNVSLLGVHNQGPKKKYRPSSGTILYDGLMYAGHILERMGNTIDIKPE